MMRALYGYRRSPQLWQKHFFATLYNMKNASLKCLEVEPALCADMALQMVLIIHVDDVSRAVEIILEKGEIGKTYNIGSSHEYSVLDIFEKISKILGQGKCTYVSDRPFNDSRYCIDSSALRALGWSENPDFHDCLRRTIQWYIEFRDWYSS